MRRLTGWAIGASAGVLAVLALGAKQRTISQASFPSTFDLSGVRISLKRTACFGTCPSYTVTIAGDGTVRFSGREFVLIPGDHAARVSPESVQALVDEFRKADFLSAKSEYVVSVTDYPTYVLGLTVGGQNKSVVDYAGVEAGMPSAIGVLENKVDAVAGTKRWIEGDDTTLSSLIAEGWDFKAATKFNLAIYSSSIEHENRTLLEHYLEINAPVIAPPGMGQSPIAAASATGDLALVRRMAKGTNEISATVMTDCLGEAARKGNPALMQFWLDRGADPTRLPSIREHHSQETILGDAVESGQLDVVRKILAFPVDVHAKPQPDQTILSWALWYAKPDQVADTVQALIRAGADVREAVSWQHTPILFAACIRPQAIAAIPTLLAAGADVNAHMDNGYTPLMSCAPHLDAVKLLLAAGADPTVELQGGRTAAQIAQEMSCPECKALILEAAKNWTPPAKTPAR